MPFGLSPEAGNMWTQHLPTESLVVLWKKSGAGAPLPNVNRASASEVLRLIAWGHSNKEIATRLDLSVKTVEVHKANGMRKLGMKSRIDIVQYAILRGWLDEA